MNFEQALAALRKGQRATRRSWSPNVTISLGRDDLDAPTIILQTPNKLLMPGWDPAERDILAEDWDVLTPEYTKSVMAKGLRSALESLARRWKADGFGQVRICVKYAIEEPIQCWYLPDVPTFMVQNKGGPTTDLPDMDLDQLGFIAENLRNMILDHPCCLGE